MASLRFRDLLELLADAHEQEVQHLRNANASLEAELVILRNSALETAGASEDVLSPAAPVTEVTPFLHGDSSISPEARTLRTTATVLSKPSRPSGPRIPNLVIDDDLPVERPPALVGHGDTIKSSKIQHCRTATSSTPRMRSKTTNFSMLSQLGFTLEPKLPRGILAVKVKSARKLNTTSAEVCYELGVAYAARVGIANAFQQADVAVHLAQELPSVASETNGGDPGYFLDWEGKSKPPALNISIPSDTSYPLVGIEIFADAGEVVDEASFSISSLPPLRKTDITVELESGGVINLEAHWKPLREVVVHEGVHSAEFEMKRKRLRTNFGYQHSGEDMEVCASDLKAVCEIHMRMHGYGSGSETETVMECLVSLADAHGMRLASEEVEPFLPWPTFETLMLSFHSFEADLEPEMRRLLHAVEEAVFDEDVPDFLNQLVAQSTGVINLFHPQEEKKKGNVHDWAVHGLHDWAVVQGEFSDSENWVHLVTNLSNTCAVFSIFLIGPEMDYIPNWVGWLVLSYIFCAAFTVELITKISVIGVKTLFVHGEDRYWNLLDVIITIMTIVDVALNTAGESSDAISTRVAVVLRAFRLARIARIFKLVKTPLLKDLGDMIVGLWIGLPKLMWVMCVLLRFTYVVAVVMRSALGPPPGNASLALESLCGDPDLMSLDHVDWPDGCKLHAVYGQVFFKSTFESMFSVFFFMLGDTYSKSGRNLNSIFAEGFGAPWKTFITVFMICVEFGLFNVIIATFVESTLAGLKYNESQRRYAQHYEGRYVLRKLTILSERILTLVPRMFLQPAASRNLQDLMAQPSHTPSRNHKKGLTRSPTMERNTRMPVGLITLSVNEFEQVMSDDEVKRILDDLDVRMDAHTCNFDAFGPRKDGTLQYSNLLLGLIRLRGDLQKADIVTVIGMIQNLQQNLKDVEHAVEATHQLQRTL